MRGHRPDICRRSWPWALVRDGNRPALTCMGSDLAFVQVPRAFVNLVKVLEIINLRQLYLEKEVSCPRIILRWDGSFPVVPQRARAPSRKGPMH